MISSCFSNSSNSISSISPPPPPPQNLTTCVYRTRIFNSPTHLTLTWSKTFSSHSLTIYAPDLLSLTIPLYASSFSSFFKNHKVGSKSIYLTQHPHNNRRIKLHWDMTRSEYPHNSAEPESRFYIAISCNARLEFFIGDLGTELTRRSGLVLTHQLSEPSLLARRQHVFGRKSYVVSAKFLGSKHEIRIECGGGVLIVKVDGEISLEVKRLVWKFRGHEKISIGGIEVEFSWDVLNWINNSNSRSGTINNLGHGVFIFQVGDGGVWPEMVGPEKKLMRKSLSLVGPASTPRAAATMLISPPPSCSSVLQWAEESSDCGRSSCSSSTRSCASNIGGFSFLVYAWKSCDLIECKQLKCGFAL